MSRFLMVSHGTAGDILQVIRLGRGLVAQGHQVLLLSHAPYREPARAAGIDFVAIDTDAEYQQHLASTPALLGLRGPASLHTFYSERRLFEQLRFEVDTLLARYLPGDTVLVGRHGSALSVPLAGEVLGAPTAWLALYPSQLITARLAEHFVERGLGASLNTIRAEYGLPAAGGATGGFTSTSTTLALWPHWFDQAGQPVPDGTALCGFPPGDEDEVVPLEAGVADVFAGAPAPVLVSGGTGRMLHPDFYPTAIAAVATLDRPAVVITPHRDLVPDPLPPNVRWLAAVPFSAALPLSGAIVHHGGIGTAMRALRVGIPQVILGYGLDRPDNAARLAGLGLAQWSAPAEWNVAHIAGQVRTALADLDYPARAAARIADDSAATAVDAAARVLLGLLASLTRTPAVSLNRFPEGCE